MANDEEAKKKWAEYYERILARRLKEADILWQQMLDSGLKAESPLVLDLLIFTKRKEDADKIAEVLSENYNAQVFSNETDHEYWDVVATTRPYGVKISAEEHREWVEYIAEIAQSYSGVFSTWCVEVPDLQKQFRSEEIDSEI